MIKAKDYFKSVEYITHNDINGIERNVAGILKKLCL